MERIIEDSKVVGSAGVVILLEYAQVFNTLITLCISICTLIYVSKRAWQVLRETFPHNKKRKKKYAKK